jgi:hypothetical protein
VTCELKGMHRGGGNGERGVVWGGDGGIATVWCLEEKTTVGLNAEPMPRISERRGHTHKNHSSRDSRCVLARPSTIDRLSAAKNKFLFNLAPCGLKFYLSTHRPLPPQPWATEFRTMSVILLRYNAQSFQLESIFTR